MLKQHKNRWFKIVDEYFLNGTSGFEGVETDNGVFVIKLRNSPLVFMIKQKGDDYDSFNTNFTIFKPGYPIWKSTEEFNHDASFYAPDMVEAQLFDWLRNVGRYLDESSVPDFWAQFNTYTLFTSTSSIPEEDLKPFTNDEKSQIRQRLLVFEDDVKKNFEPIQEQLEFINERLEYLSQAVDRLNKFDWKAQALSTLISIAVNLSVDTEGGKKLFQLFSQALEFIVKHLRSGL